MAVRDNAQVPAKNAYKAQPLALPLAAQEAPKAQVWASGRGEGGEEQTAQALHTSKHEAPIAPYRSNRSRPKVTG